ncbi:MAG TPA: SgcJ/EcaC family oxidoreductase [Terriglobales bacterium]|nr:SgcJ/EcaC family oxidoreductase [Terriglobales bacterium]
MPTHTARTTAVLLMLLLTGLGGLSAAKDQRTGLTPSDEKEIRATIEAYRTAWLTNDSRGVLKTFTDDAVLLPAHGAPAVVGKAAIEKYWFTPGAPPTSITELHITVDQVSGSSALAFARGLDNVAWTVTEDTVTRHHAHPGTYLNVMKKMPDGTWRIQVHMWDDGPERVE